MEIDGQPALAPQWASFVKDNGLEASFVDDLLKIVKGGAFSSEDDHAQKSFLFIALADKHPKFTKELATKALQILEPESTESTRISHRGPKITDGLETKLAHVLDFNAFKKRVEQLFEWHKNRVVQRKMLAPYFAVVQSSGMGKTRLFVELRAQYKSNTDCICKTILCVEANLETRQETEYFDYRFRMDRNNGTSVVEAVRETLDAIVANATNNSNTAGVQKLVLLFDEAQGLMTGTDQWGKGSLVFRAVRWWLRQERDREIVAVFAGTTAALTNFFPPDPPMREVSRTKQFSYRNYNHDENDMKKLYPPFFELNTVACRRQEIAAHKAQATDPGFPQAAIYGRPLFAHYHLEGTLDDRKMNEFENRLVLSVPKYEENLPSCYSVLGSRVQMGVVNSFHTLSTLISSGYACLVSFRQQDDSQSMPVAGVTFMPDPLCATMAMRYMDPDWKDGALGGKGKRFWVEQAERAFTTRLCLPEKGDAGEVFAALYMLFCGDELRKKADVTLSSFVVSLEEWFNRVQNGGRDPKNDTAQREEDAGSTLVSGTKTFLEDCGGCVTRSRARLNERAKKIGKFTSTRSAVSFVQICRNHFCSNSFCERERLEYMYHSGLGSYAFRNCKAFDIDSSIKVVEDSRTSFHPLLVSVKNWAKVTKGDVVGWVSSMMSFLSELRGEDTEPSAVCLIVLLGCASPPVMKGDDLCSSSLTPFPATDVYRLVCVDNDEFGVSQAIRNLGAASELSEVYSSHAFLACEKSPENLLRKSSENWGKVTELFNALKLSAPNNDASKSTHG